MGLMCIRRYFDIMFIELEVGLLATTVQSTTFSFTEFDLDFITVHLPLLVSRI